MIENNVFKIIILVAGVLMAIIIRITFYGYKRDLFLSYLIIAIIAIIYFSLKIHGIL